MKRKRKHLAKRIGEQSNIHDQIKVSLLGKIPCPLEYAARAFLEFPIAAKDLNAPEALQREALEFICNKLLDEFCGALINRDSDALRAVAKFLDKKIDRTAADPVRTKLLMRKLMHGKPILLKELAMLVGYTGPQDVLRRTAKQIGNEVIKGHGGRPRNTPTKNASNTS